MRPFSKLFLGVLLAGLCLEVGAQWNLGPKNATQQSPTCIRLTNAINIQRGAAGHDCQIHLGAEFDLEFTVNLGTNNGGADGMCFVLQQEGNVGNNLIGGNGGDIGYTGSPFIPSVAVEIDTYQNGDVGDPSFDHIAIQSNGSTTHNLESGRPSLCRHRQHRKRPVLPISCDLGSRHHHAPGVFRRGASEDAHPST